VIIRAALGRELHDVEDAGAIVAGWTTSVRQNASRHG
jgi:hypothetical protein